MMRQDDRFIELDDRVAFANRQGRGAILVSIHYNATGSSAPNGVQTFFWHANSHGLATRIQRHVVAETGETSVGVTRRRLRLTRNPEIPCVLCECAYLTNPTELRQRIAGSRPEAGRVRRLAFGVPSSPRYSHSHGAWPRRPTTPNRTRRPTTFTHPVSVWSRKIPFDNDSVKYSGGGERSARNRKGLQIPIVLRSPRTSDQSF